MLKAEQLTELAHKAADHAEACVANDLILGAEISVLSCAIYTVGAELIGRLDNLHFEADSFADKDGHLERIACTSGKIRFEVPHDNSSKSEDSSAGKEGVSTSGSPEGQRREGVKGS